MSKLGYLAIPDALTTDQQQGFDRLKNILASVDVMVMYPDFKKPFDLTTCISAHGLGAVLSQGGQPTSMTSRL